MNKYYWRRSENI